MKLKFALSHITFGGVLSSPTCALHKWNRAIARPQTFFNESCYLVIRSRRMIYKRAWRHCTAMAILKLYAAKLLEEKVWGYHFGMCRPKESRMLRWLKNLAHSSALKNYRVMGKFPNVDHLFSIRAQGVKITNGKITWIIVTPVSSYRAFSDHTLEL